MWLMGHIGDLSINLADHNINTTQVKAFHAGTWPDGGLDFLI